MENILSSNSHLCLNEQKLLKEAQTYDFQQIFTTCSKKVFNISLNIVQNTQDAEDISQEVFVEVYHSLQDFDNKSSVSTWIYRIAINKSIDFLRAKKRKKRFAFFSQLFHPETGHLLQEVSHFDHPGVILENKERAAILYKAIDKLSANQKSAFILSQIEGFPQKEIGLLMNISEKAVESLIQRAKENLRKILGNFYHHRRM